MKPTATLLAVGTTAGPTMPVQGRGTAGYARVSGTTVTRAIGVCPRWKAMPQEVCTRSVEAVRAEVAPRLGIAPAAVRTVVDEDAAVAGVRAAFAALPALGPGDRLVIRSVFHNGPARAGEVAAPDDDLIVFRTEERPAAIEFAVAQDQWMPAGDLAALVHGSGASEVVAILDARDSDAISPLPLHGHPAEMPGGRVGTTAAAGQFADLSREKAMALFSETFAAVPRSGGTLRDATSTGMSNTARTAAAIRAADAEMLEEAGMDPSLCDREPVVQDPDGPIASIVLH